VFEGAKIMKPTSVAALFAGAMAGVAAMYLLDPNQGERRRRAIASKAGTYWDEASGTVHDQWSHLADRAKDVGHHAYSAAQSFANDAIGRVKHAAGDAQSHLEDAHSQAVGQAHGWLDNGRRWFNRHRDQAVRNMPHSAVDVQNALQDYGQAAWDQARKIGWRAHDRAVDAVNRGRRAIGPEQSSPVVPVALTAVGFLALGAGAMYIVDPQKGRARRAWISDKVHSIIRRSGNTAYSKGRHWANRAYGVAAEARGAANDLVDRVYQAINGILHDPKVVKVIADANGTITLIGKVLHDQIDRIIAAVDALPGVNQVINRLEAITGKTADTQSPTQNVH
jgi:gas vesicle protein